MPEQDRSIDAAALRYLCLELAPAWLRIVGVDARYETFFSRLGAETPDGVALFLDPPPPAGHDGARVTLDYRTADGADWWLAGRLGVCDDRACVLVRQAPVRRPERARRLQPHGAEAVVGFFLDGGPGERFLLPVLDLGARGLRFESSIPFAVGASLLDVTVDSGQTQVLQQCDGAVTDCQAVVLASGRTRFRCGVRLRRGRPQLGPPPVEGPAELRHFARVRELLWAMCDFERPITVVDGDRRVRGRLAPASGERKRLPAMGCTLDAPLEGERDSRAVTVECALFGSCFEFFARLTPTGGREAGLLPAPVLREWHRRGRDRVVVDPDTDAYVRFTHPVDRSVRTRRLHDIGFSGLSFELAGDEADYWSGMPLEHASIKLGSFDCDVRRVEVRTATEGRVGLRFEDLPDDDANRLRAFLIATGSAPIQLHDGADLKELVQFHAGKNLLEPEMAAWLEANFAEVQTNWRRAHHARDGMMKTLVVPWRGAIGASLTSVRAYEATWALQHSVVRSPAVPFGSGVLGSVLMQLISPRHDGEYLVAFADAEARAVHDMLDGFMHHDGAEHRGAQELSLYAADSVDQSDLDMTGLRRLMGAGERIVENAARRLLHPVCRRALSLVAGQIELPATRAAYAAIGLERGREAWGSFHDGRCVGVLVQEFASPGLSLSGLMSAAIYLPLATETELDADRLAALCQVARGRFRPGLSQVRFLFMPKGLDDRGLVRAGFRRIGGCSVFAWHRLAVADYYRYVENRYGLLQGRLRGRGSHIAIAA